MSATFEPLRVDGDIDAALSHLGHCLLGTFGTVPKEILAAVSLFSPTNQLMLTRRKDTEEHLPSVVEYAITPLRRMNWGPHLDVAWLTLAWIAEEGVTRVNMRPMLAARDAMGMLWDWLWETLNAHGLLVGEEEDEPKLKPRPEPDFWPKKASTRAVYLEDWRKSIKPQIDKGDKLVDIAAQMNVLPSRISRIKRFAESWEEIHPGS